MKEVNRNALVVKVKQPFVDWCNQQDETHERTVNDINEQPLVLLVPSDQDPKIKIIYLESIYQDEIFSRMIKLHCDCHKRSYPKPTTKRFYEWFTVDHAYTVLDLAVVGEFYGKGSGQTY